MAYQAPLNGGRINATIGGNTAGAGALISTGTMTLVGGNNITLSQAGNALTINGAAGGGGGIALVGGASTYTTGSVTLTGAGGVSVTPGASILSISGPGVSQLTYTGAVSMSSNGSTVSIGAPIMSMGMSTSTAGGATGGTSGTVSNGLNFVAGSNITLSQSTNSNGATISIFGTSGGGGGMGMSAGTQSVSTGTMVFSNSNGVSFGMSGSSRMTASVATTYAGSNHSHGNPTLNLTNLSGTTASASNGLTLSLSAASQTVQTQSNIQGIIASGSTNRTGDISFANSNGITFGLSNNTVTASVAAGGVALSAAGGSITSGVASISATGALTASVNGQTLSLSAPVVSSLSATGAVSISNNAGVISIGAPAFSAGMSNAGNTAGTSGTASNQVIFAGGNNITLSQSTGAGGNTISIVGAAGGGGGGTLSLYAAGNTTQNSSTTANIASVTFNGIGGLSAGYSNGSIQLSAPAVSSVSATGALSMSINGNTVSMGVPAFSAGIATNSTVSNRVVFTAGTNITLGQSTDASGATIGITGDGGGGGGYTASYFNPRELYNQTLSQVGNRKLHFQPMDAPNLSFDRIALPVYFTGSSNSTGSLSVSFSAGFYSQNDSSLSLISSFSTSRGVTHNGTFQNSINSGMRILTMGAGMNLSQGRYWIGIVSATSVSSNNITLSQVIVSLPNFTYNGVFGVAAAASNQGLLGLGTYMTTTNAMPASVAFSQIAGNHLTVGVQPPLFYVSNGTV